LLNKSKRAIGWVFIQQSTIKIQQLLG